jgi:hypothetical protein
LLYRPGRRVKPLMLGIKVLIALGWFTRKGARAFRICPITHRITKLPGHDFWPDDLSMSANLAPAEAHGGVAALFRSRRDCVEMVLA